MTCRECQAEQEDGSRCSGGAEAAGEEGGGVSCLEHHSVCCNGQDTPISTPSDRTPSSTTNEADSNGIKERSPELSDDEYITDSSVDSILEEQKEREVKEKEQEEATLAVLPKAEEKKKTFTLNGMKVTIRKRPAHKVKRADRSPVC